MNHTSSLQRMLQSPFAKLDSTTLPCITASHLRFSCSPLPDPNANPNAIPLRAAQRTISRSWALCCPSILFCSISSFSSIRSARPFSPPTPPLTSETSCEGRTLVPLRIDMRASKSPSTTSSSSFAIGSSAMSTGFHSSSSGTPRWALSLFRPAVLVGSWRSPKTRFSTAEHETRIRESPFGFFFPFFESLALILTLPVRSASSTCCSS